LPVTIHNIQGLFFPIAAFVLFRLFDIVKPFPVSYFDRRFRNGLGITLDDVVAALYAVLLVELIFWMGHISSS
jgi:phosphatidylglycerophosphatase A